MSEQTATEAAREWELDEDDKVGFIRLIDILTPLLHQASEQTFGLGRWILASLLTINAGALLALANNDNVSGTPAALGGALWLVGTVLALITGLLSYRTGARGAGIAVGLISDFTIATVTGKYKLPNFSGIQKEVEKRTSRTFLVGSCSVLAFATGAGVIGWHLVANDISSLARPAVIEDGFTELDATSNEVVQVSN